MERIEQAACEWRRTVGFPFHVRVVVFDADGTHRLVINTSDACGEILGILQLGRRVNMAVCETILGMSLSMCDTTPLLDAKFGRSRGIKLALLHWNEAQGTSKYHSLREAIEAYAARLDHPTEDITPMRVDCRIEVDDLSTIHTLQRTTTAAGSNPSSVRFVLGTMYVTSHRMGLSRTTIDSVTRIARHGVKVDVDALDMDKLVWRGERCKVLCQSLVGLTILHSTANPRSFVPFLECLSLSSSLKRLDLEYIFPWRRADRDLVFEALGRALFAPTSTTQLRHLGIVDMIEMDDVYAMLRGATGRSNRADQQLEDTRSTVESFSLWTHLGDSGREVMDGLLGLLQPRLRYLELDGGPVPLSAVNGVVQRGGRLIEFGCHYDESWCAADITTLPALPFLKALTVTFKTEVDVQRLRTVTRIAIASRLQSLSLVADPSVTFSDEHLRVIAEAYPSLQALSITAGAIDMSALIDLYDQGVCRVSSIHLERVTMGMSAITHALDVLRDPARPISKCLKSLRLVNVHPRTPWGPHKREFERQIAVMLEHNLVLEHLEMVVNKRAEQFEMLFLTCQFDGQLLPIQDEPALSLRGRAALLSVIGDYDLPREMFVQIWRSIAGRPHPRCRSVFL